MQLDPEPEEVDYSDLQERGYSVMQFLTPEERQRLTYEHLETIRLKKLRMPTRYTRSRLFGKEFIMPRERHPLSGPSWKTDLKLTPITGIRNVANMEKKFVPHANNSLAPFYSMGKPTCGYFFSRQTNNKKLKFGIPPADLVKWRSLRPQVQLP